MPNAFYGCSAFFYLERNADFSNLLVSLLSAAMAIGSRNPDSSSVSISKLRNLNEQSGLHRHIRYYQA